jgi:outer membrane protein insertion porin family
MITRHSSRQGNSAAPDQCRGSLPQYAARILAIVHVLLLSLTVVHAQEGVTSTGAAYEGEHVDSVDLVTNPSIDVEPLRALLVQKAGQPYSQKEVDASITALEGTHRFTQVRAVATVELSGLRLSFILEPAYYVGSVEFPEAARRFSYVRLLQVVSPEIDYLNEKPYDKALLPKAETALRDFLKHNGYFAATVQAEIRLDDTHQLVNITFRGNLGRRARIGRVEIQGATPAETDRLMHSVRSLRARFTGGLLKPGKTYTASRLQQAASLIKNALAGQHYLAAKVEPLSPDYFADTNRVNITFKVNVGPQVIIQIEGASLTWVPFLAGREKRKLIPIYSEGTIDRDLVNEGQQNLMNYFQKKGYFDVKVATDFQRQPEKILLTYHIDRGRKHKLSQIAFRGNHALASENLLSHIPLKKAHFWSHGTFSDKLLKTSADNIEALYHDAGYEEVKVTSDVKDHEPTVDVTFTIVEGPQTTIDKVSITGNKSIPDKTLTGSGFELKPGSPFSPGKLATDRNRITVAYLDRGYMKAEVKVVVRRAPDDPHQVDVDYAITENQEVRISEILYEGQKRTRLSLLREATRLKPETPMSERALLAAETRLYDLNVFDWSSVQPKKPVTNNTEAEPLVKVHEAKRTEITYGFGFEISRRGGNVPGGTIAVPGLPTINVGNNQVAPSQATYASPRGSIEFLRRNMRGLGETASFSLLVSRLDQRALASYNDPHLRGSEWAGLTSLSYERTTENPLFAANLADASFQVERVISRKTDTRVQFRYDFNHTTLSQLLVPELVLPRDRNVRLSTVSGTFIRDTRDQPLDAHKGSFSTVDLGITPTAFGSSADFSRLFAQHAFYKPIHGMVWANSVRLGLVKAFSNSFVPTSQLFFAGGGTTLRGFPVNEAGPQRVVPFCNVLTGNTGCVNITVPVGGRQLFVVNTELRFPLKILKALGGVVFYDGGNVYSAINFNQFVNNYTNTIGIGLRYSTPIGPIRIDFGHNLNPVPGISPNQYFITVGQAF